MAFEPERNDETNLKRFRAAMDMSLDMIYLVDRDTLSFVVVNACRNAGLTREQIMALGPCKNPGFNRDVTARKQAELKAFQLQQLFLALSLTNGVILRA